LTIPLRSPGSNDQSSQKGLAAGTKDGGYGVGTWDVGPFDNDKAADWCGDLDDAAPEQRVQLIRDALTEVADHGDDYLHSTLAEVAIAAAAIVASQLPGGDPITSPYAPDFLRDGGSVNMPEDIANLGLRALDRVVGDNSEWRELWEDASPESYAEAVAALTPIRSALRAARS